MNVSICRYVIGDVRRIGSGDVRRIGSKDRSGHRPFGIGVVVAIVSSTLAACGSPSSQSSHSSKTAATSSPTSSSSSSPAVEFSVAEVSGLGTVVVDGRGRTVYVFTSDGHTNAPCSGASGCTKVWPDLALPAGVSSARAGNGIHAALLGKMKSSNGEIYPTYDGWLMYEYVGDSAPGQGTGQGISSFGGTWYALSTSGTPVGAPQ